MLIPGREKTKLEKVSERESERKSERKRERKHQKIYMILLDKSVAEFSVTLTSAMVVDLSAGLIH